MKVLILFGQPHFYVNNATGARFLGTSGGMTRVGIGTAPHSTYMLTVGSNIWVNGVQVSSDEALKKNIKNLDKSAALSGLLKVEGKKYEFKDESELTSLYEQNLLNFGVDTVYNSDKSIKEIKLLLPKFDVGQHYGLIAQDIEKLFPELVSQDSASKIKSINYTGFIPIIIEGMKAQQQKIDELNEANDNLQKELVSLQAQIDKLSATEEHLKSGELLEPENNLLLNSEASLSQNSPNPFSEETVINYFLPETTAKATLYIYDMNGTQLKSIGLHQTGNGNVTINGGEFNAGMFMYTMIVDGQVIDTKTMVLTD